MPATRSVVDDLLTVRPPFEGSRIGVPIAQARGRVVTPSAIHDGIPGDIERAVLRWLAQNPASRFPDAASLGDALDSCAFAGDWDEGRAADWRREAGRAWAVPV